jgi:predicted RNA-binding Zn-ribbon protein involved in translation (DUF1610 family)
MRLSAKKTYCPSCKKLVRGRERENGDEVGIVCPRCGGAIWKREGMTWRYAAISMTREVGLGQAEGVSRTRQERKTSEEV